MCGGKIADVAADVIWKILIGSGQVKVKSWHVRGSLLSVIKIAHRMSQVQIDFVLNVIDAGESNKVLLTIPPEVVHGVHNRGTAAAIISIKTLVPSGGCLLRATPVEETPRGGSLRHET